MDKTDIYIERLTILYRNGVINEAQLTMAVSSGIISDSDKTVIMASISSE